MRKCIQYCLIFAFFMAIFSACSVREQISADGELHSNIPKITLLETFPSSISSSTDSLTFVVEYFDGDGDLGFDEINEKTIFVVDIRNNEIRSFHLPTIAPQTLGGVAIEGTLNIVLNKITLLDNSNAVETATFSIYIKDREGNSSNREISPEITIYP